MMLNVGSAIVYQQSQRLSESKIHSSTNRTEINTNIYNVDDTPNSNYLGYS